MLEQQWLESKRGICSKKWSVASFTVRWTILANPFCPSQIWIFAVYTLGCCFLQCKVELQWNDLVTRFLPHSQIWIIDHAGTAMALKQKGHLQYINRGLLPSMYGSTPDKSS